jgi:hypothetical protein
MDTVTPLPQIAQEKNWMEFALLLESAMERFDSYGLPNPGAVRAAVGRLRRQLPSSLSTALKAMQFLRDRHPDVLAGRDASIGCAQVRVLSRIDAVSREAAAAVEGLVFAGSVRTVDLQAFHRALREQAQEREPDQATLAA